MENMGKRMKKIFITGGTGFIGRAVCKELIRRGYEVHASVYPSENSVFGVVSHPLDLTDDQVVNLFLKKHHFESMIHLAWYTGVKCHSSDVNLDWTMTSLKLIQRFVKYGGKTFLGAGSVSEYDFSDGYLQEYKTPLMSPSLYGECKAAVYNMARIFLNSHDVDFKWARIFNLYGPNEKTTRLMPSVIRSALKNEDIRVSDCKKFQDYLYVSDTARGIVDLFESSVSGAVNICSGTPVRLRTIVEKIAELTRFKGKILWGVLPCGFEDPIVVGSNRRLTNEVGWEQRVDLEEGLLKTIKWWREHDV